MNEKADFEVIFKRCCKYVTYVTIRTTSLITISIITNQDWVNQYLLHYYLFLKFSRTLYINWITWHTEYDTIYKNISNLKK